MVDLTNKILLLSVVFLCLSIGICFANPFLIGEPLENNTDYYVLFVDDDEFVVEPSLDELFIYDLQDLKDGRHYIEIMAVDCEDEEGAIISFYLRKDTKKKHAEYKLERDMDSDIFDEPIRIKIKKDKKRKKFK